MRGIPTMHPDVELLVFFSCWKSAGEGGVRRGNRQQSDKMAFGTPIPTEQEGGRCLIRSANVDCAISDARYRSGSHVAFSSPLHIINIIDQISTARYCMMLVRYRGVCEPSKFSRPFGRLSGFAHHSPKTTLANEPPGRMKHNWNQCTDHLQRTD